MSWLSRVVNVFRADRVSREIDEELQFHLDSRIEDLVRAGARRSGDQGGPNGLGSQGDQGHQGGPNSSCEQLALTSSIS
jgi:hypothetical protein